MSVFKKANNGIIGREEKKSGKKNAAPWPEHHLGL